MSDHEFLGEYPSFAPRPAFNGDVPARGYVSGNYVAEPGAYTCVRCQDPFMPPQVLKAGDRLPICPRCGPAARWRKG